MKEYLIKTSDNKVNITNYYIKDDSISLDQSMNSAGQIKFGLPTEKSIFKCTLIQSNNENYPRIPDLTNQKITVSYTEDDNTVKLGDFIVNKFERGGAGNPLINLTAYSEAIPEMDDEDDALERLSSFLQLYMPYAIKRGGIKFEFDLLDFIYPYAKIKNIGSTNLNNAEIKFEKMETIVVGDKAYDFYYYYFDKKGIYDIWIAGIEYFSSNALSFIKGHGDDRDTKLLRYIYYMSNQFGNYNSSVYNPSFPIIGNYLYTSGDHPEINPNITPKLMRMPLGFKIVYRDANNPQGNIDEIEMVSNEHHVWPQKEIYRSFKTFEYEITDMPTEKSKLKDFFKIIADSSELYFNLFIRIDEDEGYGEKYYTEIKETEFDALYPAEDLYPLDWGKGIPRGADKTVYSDRVISDVIKAQKPFGKIKVNFTDNLGNNYSFIRRIKKDNRDIFYNSLDYTVTQDTAAGTTTFTLNDFDSEQMKLDVYAHEIHAITADKFGHTLDDRLIYKSDYGPSNLVIEGPWVNDIKKIVVDTITDYAYFEVRDEESYREHTYDDSIDTFTYELDNYYLSGGFLDWRYLEELVNELEEKLKTFKYSPLNISIENEFEVQSGDFIEVHTYDVDNVPIAAIGYVNAMTTKGGQLLISDIKS